MCAHPPHGHNPLTRQIDGKNITDVSELLPEKLHEGGVPRWTRVSGAGDGRKRQPDDAIGLEALDVLLLMAHQAHLHALHGPAVERQSVFDHPASNRAAIIPGGGGYFEGFKGMDLRRVE